MILHCQRQALAQRLANSYGLEVYTVLYDTCIMQCEYGLGQSLRTCKRFNPLICVDSRLLIDISTTFSKIE